MLDLFATLGALIASLGNAQSVAAVKERMALIQDQFALARDEAMQLRAENERLAQALDQCKHQLAAQTRTQQFTQHAGALFRRDAAGRYERVVYCPTCRISTAAWPEGEQFHCSACGWFSAFREDAITSVMAGLPR